MRVCFVAVGKRKTMSNPKARTTLRTVFGYIPVAMRLQYGERAMRTHRSCRVGNLAHRAASKRGSVAASAPPLRMPALLINQFDDVITWIGKTRTLRFDC